MHKRLFRLGIILLSGLVVWVLLRQRRTSQTPAPMLIRYFEPDQTPPDTFVEHAIEAPLHVDDADPAEQADLVEDAIEAPLYVGEADPIELAFVAGAVGIDLAPDDTATHNEASSPVPPKPEAELAAGTLVGYCMRCHTKRTISSPTIEITKDGRRAARGTCAVCGANIVRFVKEQA